jgi:hypothetical protein
MTSIQFNEKYKDYLSEGHYGLALEDKDMINYLDKEFQELIKIPNFKYSQIKQKFEWFRFYAKELSLDKIDEIEHNLRLIQLSKYE